MPDAAIPFALPFSHYVTLGYHPIPIIPQSKVPAGGKGWNEKTYDYADLDKGAWSVGILCDNVVGLDIDNLIADQADEMEATVRRILKLPKSTPIRVGRAPKRMLIARVDAPVKGWDISRGRGKDSTIFQLLGAGKQFVIHGIHPDTQKPYTLSRALPPWGKLPCVTQEQLEALRVALGGGTTHETVQPTGKFSGPRWTETGMIQAFDALVELDPAMKRESWIKVGMAIHDGTHGDAEGFELFEAWSNGSVSGGETPSNYVESGPESCLTAWRSFHAGGGTTRATLFQNDFLKMKKKEKPASQKHSKKTGRPSVLGILDEAPKPTKWLVNNVISHGAHLLVGRPKGGKSWLLLELVRAVASGERFLAWSTNPCEVLWFSVEETQNDLNTRITDTGGWPDVSEHVEPYLLDTFNKIEAFEEETLLEWLDRYLTEHPSVGLVVMDTHATLEAMWVDEKIDTKRHAAIVDQAYQRSRVYDKLGHKHGVAIILTHHTRKKNGKEITDFHELINLPQTVVAGASSSIVLADHPESDIYNDVERRRVFAVRGRRVKGDLTYQISFDGDISRFVVDGKFIDVKRSEAAIEVLACVEELLTVQPSVTYLQIARALGKHEKTIAATFKILKRDPASMVWKGRRVVIRPKVGVTFE